jgi:hypothetical protein
MYAAVVGAYDHIPRARTVEDVPLSAKQRFHVDAAEVLTAPNNLAVTSITDESRPNASMSEAKYVGSNH